MDIFIRILTIAISGLIGGLLVFGLAWLFQRKKSEPYPNPVTDLIRLVTNEMNDREKNNKKKIETLEQRINFISEQMEMGEKLLEKYFEHINELEKKVYSFIERCEERFQFEDIE